MQIIGRSWERFILNNNFDKALDAYKNCLEIELIIFPSNHTNIGYTHRQIGIIYSKQQQYDEALSSLQKCLIILSSSLPTGHLNLIDTENLMIEILNNQ